MYEGTNPSSRRDGFIAARKGQLAEAIVADPGLPAGDAPLLADLFRLLGAYLHHESHEHLDELKALYFPLDPDAAPSLRDTSPDAFDTFEAALIEALGRANFVEIDPDTVQTREATKRLTGLAIKPSDAGIRRIRYFARGARSETIEVKSWFGLRKHQIEVQMMSDVVVLVGFKASDEILRSDRKAFAATRRGVNFV